MFPLTCMLVCAKCAILGTRDRGCSAHPAFPAPSVLKEGQRIWKARAKTRREIAKSYPPLSSSALSELRTGRTSSIPETPVIKSISRSVLDAPPEPVIGLAEGETQWRGMTVCFTAPPTQLPDPAPFFSTHSTSRETKSPSLRSLTPAVMIAAEQHGQARFDMARMRAIDAAVRILEKEGVSIAFGVPGAAINPLYSALKLRGSIKHILARHVEGASHMAEGYTRAKAGNIGVCIGTSGPAGTDMITGLYSAIADSIPILCITGQAPRARLYKEDFQAIDIESIAKPVTKWAVTVREPGLVPRVFSQAFHIMRSGRPGPVLIDLPLDVQLAEIEFDDATYSPLPVYKPVGDARAGREGAGDAQCRRAAADRRRRRRHQCRRFRSAGDVRRNRQRAGGADADGVGRHPRRSRADGGHGRPADQPPLRQRHHAAIRLRARDRQPLGQPAHRLGRDLHQGPQVRACRYRADADRPRLQSRSRHRLRCQSRARTVRHRRQGVAQGGKAQRAAGMAGLVPGPQAHHAAPEQLSTTSRSSRSASMPR